MGPIATYLINLHALSHMIVVDLPTLTIRRISRISHFFHPRALTLIKNVIKVVLNLPLMPRVLHKMESCFFQKIYLLLLKSARLLVFYLWNHPHYLFKVPLCSQFSILRFLNSSFSFVQYSVSSGFIFNNSDFTL